MADRQYGGFWRRLFAFLVDEVILYFASLILFLTGMLAFGLNVEMMDRALSSIEGTAGGISVIALIYIATSLLSGMIYFTAFHGIAGRTPGKMLLGLRVIQTSGAPITPGIAFLRWVGYLISGPLFCLGFLWVAFDSRKQGWHDKIAATVVIRRQSGPDTAASEESSDASAEPLSSEEPEISTSRKEELVETPLPVAPDIDSAMPEKWLDKPGHFL